MTLIDELREEARGEIEATKGYRNLASRLRAAGHYSEGNLVDSVADDEDRHANLLMTLANSIMAKQEPEEIKLGEEMIEIPLGRSFPETYGDWVNLAEDIKDKYPDDPVMRASVNYQLGYIAEEDEYPEEAQEAKRWLTKQAGKLQIE